MRSFQNTIKLTLVLVIIASLFIASSTIVMAKQDITVEEAQNGVYATFDPSKASGKWDGGKARVAGSDGKSLVLKTNDAGNIMGFTAKGLKEGVYKIGYYFTINKVDESDRRLRLKPLNEDLYFNISYTDLAAYAGKKVIIVTIVRVEEGKSRLDFGLWKDLGVSGSLDKIVVASNDYNFIAGSLEYELILEDVPQDVEPVARNRGYENPTTGEWTRSENAPDPNNTNPDTNTESPDESAPSTSADTSQTLPDENDDTDNIDSSIWLIIIIILLLGIGGVVAYFDMRKRNT